MGRVFISVSPTSWMFIFLCFQLGTIGHLKRLQSTFMQDGPECTLMLVLWNTWFNWNKNSNKRNLLPDPSTFFYSCICFRTIFMVWVINMHCMHANVNNDCLRILFPCVHSHGQTTIWIVVSWCIEGCRPLRVLYKDGALPHIDRDHTPFESMPFSDPYLLLW